MRHRWLLIVPVLLCAAYARAQTPTVVQVVDDFELSGSIGGTEAFTASSGDTVKVRFNQPTGANDLLVVGIAVGTTSSFVTVADDASGGSNTYTKENESDTSNVQQVETFYSCGAKSADTVTFSFSGTTPVYGIFLSESTNVATSACLDKSHGNFASSATVTAGSSGTLGASGDLVIQYVDNDSGDEPITWTKGSQTDITWAKLANDTLAVQAVQWGVYSSTTALNATLTQSSSSSFVTIALFFEAASAGTAPSGMYITAGKHLWFTGASFDASPRTEAFSCPSGNLMYLPWISVAGDTFSAPTDSESNSWVQTGAEVTDGGSISTSHNYYAAGATVSGDQTITLTSSQTSGSAIVYCVAGAASSSPFDKTATNSGDQTATGTTLTTSGDTVSITPATSNGLCFAQVGVDFNTMTGMVGSGQYFHSAFWSAEVISQGGLDQNNGWGVYPNPSTSSVGYQWDIDSSSTAVDWWVSRADCFEATGGGGGTTIVPALPLLGTGVGD